MRALLLLVAAASLCACGDEAGAARDGGDVDAATSADLGATTDGAVDPAAHTIVRVHYPAAGHGLSLRGDGAGLSWSAGLALVAVAGEPDTFSIDLGVVGGTAPFEVKPILDDSTWSRGGNYHARAGATTDLYPHFFATHGAVVTLFASFSSTKLGNSRAVWAYLPAGYDENPTARYPVLYMHDGQNLFDPTLAFGGNEWRVDETLDAAAEMQPRPIREIIVIGVANGGAARIAEYTPTMDPGYAGSGRGADYLAFLVDELRPVVNTMLRTQPGRETTGMLGSSLGGLVSTWGGVDRPDVFGVIGAMSPSTWWDSEAVVAHVAGLRAAPDRPLRAYVDSGGADDGGDETAHLADAWRGRGYQDGVDFLQVLDPGAQHNETYWAARLPAALAFLFPPP